MGDVFGLATGNMLPHVNLTLLERIGVNAVGNVKTRSCCSVLYAYGIALFGQIVV